MPLINWPDLTEERRERLEFRIGYEIRALQFGEQRKHYERMLKRVQTKPEREFYASMIAREFDYWRS